jgi:Tfp pilus assembly protein PilX
MTTARHSCIRGPVLNRALPGGYRQRGAVLIVGLVMLTVMTLLVVSMLKTSIIDLKIGGMSQDAMANASNADIGLTNYFNINNNAFQPNCAATAGTGCAVYTPPAVTGGAVLVTANQVYCKDKPGFTGNQVGSAFQAIVVDAISQATSSVGNATRLHAGIEQDLPPGACGA